VETWRWKRAESGPSSRPSRLRVRQDRQRMCTGSRSGAKKSWALGSPFVSFGGSHPLGGFEAWRLFLPCSFRGKTEETKPPSRKASKGKCGGEGRAETSGWERAESGPSSRPSRLRVRQDPAIGAHGLTHSRTEESVLGSSFVPSQSSRRRVRNGNSREDAKTRRRVGVRFLFRSLRQIPSPWRLRGLAAFAPVFLLRKDRGNKAAKPQSLEGGSAAVRARAETSGWQRAESGSSSRPSRLRVRQDPAIGAHGLTLSRTEESVLGSHLVPVQSSRRRVRKGTSREGAKTRRRVGVRFLFRSLRQVPSPWRLRGLAAFSPVFLLWKDGGNKAAKPQSLQGGSAAASVAPSGA
jgi:hypothetical protein